ncbi:hypothetical protein MRB53_019895 [Persea americana]|uniref:Uncharacterized protein n=1 Tax=Persea americana TaxID=3435 RepID=A0ACC2L011_PERAE|nr:hypothetical protein MRB53_019895 [Persea americana]|eukprot:TRINITY_DN17050_c0_g1_i1.p1 TRINITY_DN17050_c0_g1~~TRINITY_DN17050_c0_g1_i1.p1  ORF type:complete len:396 (-),score=46.94 TRINITY_DN17050_c0_g1_i1:331-1518(-)
MPFSTSYPRSPFLNPHLLIAFCLFLSPKNHLVQSCYTSIFSFGDSLADTGNLLHSHPDKVYLVGQFPYGQTYFNRPTGRFSDGRLVLDFIAQAFGIPLLPPYLARSIGQDLRRGVNFAVGGATALDADFFEERGIRRDLTNNSLRIQLEWFEELLPSLCNTTSSCRDFLRGSLFIVGEIGGNDYGYPFTQGLNLEEVTPNIVPQVISAIGFAIERLIERGAVTILVPGSQPFGCGSEHLTLAESSNKDDYDPVTGCLKEGNEFAYYHNSLLERELDRLRELYPYCTIIYADYYNAAVQVFLSPLEYGFCEDILSACCGGGGPYNYNSSAVCGAPGTMVCSDPSLYWNWDGTHLTEAAYRWIANGLIQGPFAVPPINSVCTKLAQNVRHPNYELVM